MLPFKVDVYSTQFVRAFALRAWSASNHTHAIMKRYVYAFPYCRNRFHQRKTNEDPAAYDCAVPYSRSAWRSLHAGQAHVSRQRVSLGSREVHLLTFQCCERCLRSRSLDRLPFSLVSEHSSYSSPRSQAPRHEGLPNHVAASVLADFAAAACVSSTSGLARVLRLHEPCNVRRTARLDGSTQPLTWVSSRSSN